MSAGNSPREREHAEAIERCAAAWRAAGQDLGIEVTAPFVFAADGVSHACIAHLPHFGGPKGMIALLWRSGDERSAAGGDAVLDAARAAGLWLSLLNAKTYGRYVRGEFVDALSDWGYFGPASTRPSWLIAPH